LQQSPKGSANLSWLLAERNPDMTRMYIAWIRI